MTRREIRDSAFKLVFEQLLRDDDINELYEIAEEIDEITVNDEVKQLVADVAAIVAKADGMVLFGDTAMSADPANTYLDYVAQVYGCKIDGAGFVAGLTNDLG